MDVYNIENWRLPDTTAQALTLYFDTTQPWYDSVAAALHLGSYKKNNASQWTSDPQVYPAFRNANDIYGNDSLVFFNYILYRTKVYI